MSQSPPASEGPGVLWTPPPDVRETTEIGRYTVWLEQERGLAFDSYESLQRWSVDDLAAFWASIWDFFEVKAHAPYTTVLASDAMPGARWFPGARLNFAEHLLGRDDDADAVAIVAHSQTRDADGADVRRAARAGRARPRRACCGSASARATASSPTCRTSPRRSSRSRPPRASARSGRAARPSSAPAASSTGSRSSSRRSCWPSTATASATARSTAATRWRRSAPPCRACATSCTCPTAEHAARPTPSRGPSCWPSAAPLEFVPVAFDHPLYVLFSSGTTGLPKAIVHGHGGILLEHLKAHALSWDLKPGGRLQWFTTTSWMMWNALVSALLARSSIVMLDGDPGVARPRLAVAARRGDAPDASWA